MPIKKDEPRSFHSGQVFYQCPELLEDEKGNPQVIEIEAEEAIKFAEKLIKHARWAAEHPGSGGCSIFMHPRYKGNQRVSPNAGELYVITSLNFPQSTPQELKEEAERARARAAKAGQ